MQDFPMFTTEYGVASLILKEVPYRQEAYIIIQSALQPEELLKECVSFCRMVGAEKIYARGHEITESYPLHCSIYEMRGRIDIEEEKVENLWPVTEETIASWREFLNSQMRCVDNAATLDKKSEKEILEKGGAYFIHKEGKLLGIGRVKGEELRFLASFAPGAGETVVRALASALYEERCVLEVASANNKAIALYERLGFLKTGEISRWYRVFG